VDNIHDELAYMFCILTIEHNNSPEEVKEPLVQLDKFMTSSIADRRSKTGFVRCVARLSSCLEGMSDLIGGVGSGSRCRNSHTAIHRGAK
jgi:hypothetical protein